MTTRVRTLDPKLLVATLVVAAGCSAPVERTIVYDARFGDDTSLDLYSPDLAPGDARPAIMIVHGGAWKHGDRSDFRAVARVFARAGYVTASVDYRLGAEGRRTGRKNFDNSILN